MTKFKDEIPKDHTDLLQQCNAEGFIFYKGMEIPAEIHPFFFDLNNYDPESPNETLSNEIPQVPEPYKEILTKAFIKKFPFFSDAKKITWDAKIMHEGYGLYMHREYLYIDPSHQISDVTPYYFMTWLTPFNFEGRDFVYGELKDPAVLGPLNNDSKGPEGFNFTHEALNLLGRLRPDTGMCCFLDRVDPKWWHAVDKMPKGGPVVMIGAYIEY